MNRIAVGRDDLVAGQILGRAGHDHMERAAVANPFQRMGRPMSLARGKLKRHPSDGIDFENERPLHSGSSRSLDQRHVAFAAAVYDPQPLFVAK